MTVRLRPALRKLNLTAHVTSSVGWLGAVAGFLVLSIAGMRSTDVETVRAAYVAMNLIGLYAIVPLSLAALTTGLVQSLGTRWGLFRHHWVVTKFALTIGATALLMLHQFTAVAGAARRVSETAAGTLPNVGRLGPQLVGDAALAVLVLLAATVLSVFKPWGLTSYGRRALAAESGAAPPATGAEVSTGARIVLVLLLLLAVAFVAMHLAGGGLAHHGR